jgi:Flp pilus assembly CpaE family ATPase
MSMSNGQGRGSLRMSRPAPGAETIDRSGSELSGVPAPRTPNGRIDASGGPDGSGRSPTQSTGAPCRVLLGVADVAFQQEVLDFLGRDSRVDVAGATDDAPSLRALATEGSFDALVVSPELIPAARCGSTDGGEGVLVVVAAEMTVPVLREAIEAGAHAVHAWPEERSDLAETLIRLRIDRADEGQARGRVIAVRGTRGGAGATFLVSHLAAAFARLGLRTVLVDMDRELADLTVALDACGDDVRTIQGLIPVLDELSPDLVESALFRHPRDFSVLLGPADQTEAVPSGLYTACVALLAGSFDCVLMHLPHALDQLARRAFALADEIVLVGGVDAMSLYGARRLLRALEGGSARCHLVLNRRTRDRMREKDVERLLGVGPLACIRFDAAIQAAQRNGELLSPRSRKAWRDVENLARLLVPGRSLQAARALEEV